MGMVLELRAVSAELVPSLTEQVEVVNAVLFGEDEWDDDDSDEMFGEIDVDAVRAQVATSVDLDKSWHGVHFLLTRTEWDTGTLLGQAILGGQEVGEDGGYGHPRLLPPNLVRDVSAALTSVDPGDLRARFDPAAFDAADIYPSGIWHEEDILDTYLLANLNALTTFYADAAKAGHAVLAALC